MLVILSQLVVSFADEAQAYLLAGCWDNFICLALSAQHVYTPSTATGRIQRSRPHMHTQFSRVSLCA